MYFKKLDRNLTLLAVASPLNLSSVSIEFDLEYQVFGANQSPTVSVYCGETFLARGTSSPISVNVATCNCTECNLVVYAENAVSPFALSQTRFEFADTAEDAPTAVYLTISIL